MLHIYKGNIKVSSRIVYTVFIPELSSGTWLGHFQKFGKIYFVIRIQIITSFEHIFLYFEYNKYGQNI